MLAYWQDDRPLVVEGKRANVRMCDLNLHFFVGSTQRVLHLEVGQPSTGAPGPVKEAAIQAIQGERLFLGTI